MEWQLCQTFHSLDQKTQFLTFFFYLWQHLWQLIPALWYVNCHSYIKRYRNVPSNKLDLFILEKVHIRLFESFGKTGLLSLMRATFNLQIFLKTKCFDKLERNSRIITKLFLCALYILCDLYLRATALNSYKLTYIPAEVHINNAF